MAVAAGVWRALIVVAQQAALVVAVAFVGNLRSARERGPRASISLGQAALHILHCCAVDGSTVINKKLVHAIAIWSGIGDRNVPVKPVIEVAGGVSIWVQFLHQIAF